MSCISTIVLFFSQLVFRPFSDNMKMIAKSIEDFILRKHRSNKRVQLQPFNSATIITYVNNMAIAEHRDQDFKKDGSFDQINNSRIRDTATAVLCFGDPRHLDFTIHKVTQRKNEKICKSKSFNLTHGSLFVLHPNDEKPLVRPFCSKNEPSFFKHSCKGVAKGRMSLGIVSGQYHISVKLTRAQDVLSQMNQMVLEQVKLTKPSSSILIV